MADQNLKSLAFFQDDLLENQWPVLSCSAAKELQIDSKIKTTDLTVTGNVGIATTAAPTARLEVNGNVKATSFLGDGSNLTGVVKNLDLAVKKAGDTMTGPLTIQNSLTVTGNLSVTNVLEIGGGNLDRDWMQKGINITWDSDSLFIGLKDQGPNRKDAVIAWGDDLQDDLRFVNVLHGGDVQGQEVMRIKPSGNVGVGTDSPSERLEVNGNVKATSFLKSSSRKLKENILKISPEEAVDALAELNPVKYNLKDDKDKNLHLGFIAEDVPDLVASRDRQSISNDHIVALLTKVIKEQEKRLLELAEKVEILEKKS